MGRLKDIGTWFLGKDLRSIGQAVEVLKPGKKVETIDEQSNSRTVWSVERLEGDKTSNPHIRLRRKQKGETVTRELDRTSFGVGETIRRRGLLR